MSALYYDYRDNDVYGATLSRIRSSYPTSLTGFERHSYFMDALAPDDRDAYVFARNRLVELNRALVYSVARKLAGRSHSVDVEDLVSAGYQALLLKVVDWDPMRASFSTFATPWLTKAMNEAVMVARHGKRHTAEAIDEANRLAFEYSDVPVVERGQFSRLAFFRSSPSSVEQWTRVASQLGDVASIDALGGDVESCATLVARACGEHMPQLESLLAELSEVECSIVTMVYGLSSDPMPPAEVADVLNLSGDFVWSAALVKETAERACRRLRSLAGA